MQAGVVFLLARERDRRVQGPPQTQCTQVTSFSKDIVAHTAEDADGRFLKSGYAVPTKLHHTAVASQMTAQSNVRPAPTGTSAGNVPDSLGIYGLQVQVSF